MVAVHAGPADNAAVDDAPVESTVTDLGDEVFMIDTRMGGYAGITASYLIRGSRPCLIETGTARSAPLVTEQLARLGVGADDLACVVVTHIHLDHAGGVGDIAAAFPNARVVVQAKGARHLADPSRLVASAHRVFGETMDRLFGDLLPTPAERLDVIEDIGQIDLGDGRSLEAFHNPGHASHHLGFVDSLTGDLYTGDAAGVYVPETAEVRPATPPPDFDLDLTLRSLQRMRDARATRLLFSHYGPVQDVASTLEASEVEIHRWIDWVRQAREVSPDTDHAIALVRERDREANPAHYADDALVQRYEELSGIAANVNGISRWLDQQSPAQG